MDACRLLGVCRDAAAAAAVAVYIWAPGRAALRSDCSLSACSCAALPPLCLLIPVSSLSIGHPGIVRPPTYAGGDQFVSRRLAAVRFLIGGYQIQYACLVADPGKMGMHSSPAMGVILWCKIPPIASLFNIRYSGSIQSMITQCDKVQK